jgi:diguanylate cyclase
MSEPKRQDLNAAFHAALASRWPGHRCSQRQRSTTTPRPGPRRIFVPHNFDSGFQIRQIFPILVTALLGAILSVLAWFVVARWEDRTTLLEFNARTNNIVLTLQAGINEDLNQIVALRALFESSTRGVTRGEFKVFAQELLKAHAAILSVSWVPRVNRDERAAHELAAVRDGVVGYHIKSVAPDGSFAAAQDEDEYFPVYYTTEKQGADTVYGIDLNDNGLREEVLNKARDSNQMAASKIFELKVGKGDRRGFFVLLPVYRQGVPNETVAERRRNLVGFVQGVFQSSVMIEAIIGAFKTPIDLAVFTPGSGPSALPIHVYHSSLLRGESIAPNTLGAFTRAMHWIGPLDVADTKWILVSVPATVRTSLGHGSAWLLMIAGLLLTGVVIAFLWSSARYALTLLQANQKISELAQTDALTNLPNRRALVDRLGILFNDSRHDARPFAVHYIDLDQFKNVNDTLGHSIGDNLLQQASDRLIKAVRQSDFVARFGGDEFVVLQTDAFDIAASSAVAAKIIATLSEPYVIGSNEVYITASIGISQSSSELEGPDEAMMQADIALYRAKGDGRNCFRFHSRQLDQQIKARVMIADELRVAIKGGQIELYYQPQVEITSGQIVGLEALVRWNHPKHGFVAPSLFIPIAEETGSIVALGKWVFDEACRQLKLWQDEEIAPAMVAVNLSAIQCKRCDLEQDMAESLERWGIKPGKMEVELTESVLMETTQQQSGIIERIRKLGLNVAIDDFGTGYSSLNYLTKYPVDRLKIAQELVFGVTTDSRHSSVVRAAIRLAQELNIEVIAEGVESAEQALFLVSAGCKYAQGYYFSRPIGAESATKLLRDRAGVFERLIGADQTAA